MSVKQFQKAPFCITSQRKSTLKKNPMLLMKIDCSSSDKCQVWRTFTNSSKHFMTVLNSGKFELTTALSALSSVWSTSTVSLPTQESHSIKPTGDPLYCALCSSPRRCGMIDISQIQTLLSFILSLCSIKSTCWSSNS